MHTFGSTARPGWVEARNGGQKEIAVRMTVESGVVPAWHGAPLSEENWSVSVCPVSRKLVRQAWFLLVLSFVATHLILYPGCAHCQARERPYHLTVATHAVTMTIWCDGKPVSRTGNELHLVLILQRI